MSRKIALFLLVLAATLGAQTFGDGILVTASRSVAITPSTAVITVSVLTSPAQTLDEVVPKVKDLGLALENLQSVISTPGFSSGVPGAPTVAGTATYSFHTTTPLTQAAAYIQRVAAFATASPTLRASATSAIASVTAAVFQEAVKKLSGELFQEAKARAQELAGETGLKVGRVLAITDSYSTYSAVSSYIFSSFQYPISISVRFAIED